MNFDRVLSIITMAALAGLVILNASQAETIIKSLSAASTSYISTVQGR